MSLLFEPLRIGDITYRNRLVVSPMCQYSSDDGFANDWHLVHLGSRAVGGAGLIFTEAAAVEASGRISPQDLGLWKDEHIPYLKRLTDFIKAQGASPGIQLAHAGRKASTARPWHGGAPLDIAQGGWRPISAPSAIAFASDYPIPEELSIPQLEAVQTAFALAAERALRAGFEVIELHAAHGYLLHEFLSPLSNQRTDAYGGSLENRLRMVIETAQHVRRAWPSHLPLWVRISATDWVDGGWDLDQSITLAKHLKNAGVDLIDCSSGGSVPAAKIPMGAGFQTPFAQKIRAEAGLMTGAVGMITEPAQAETILRTQQADVIVMARELLRQPYWPLHAAAALHSKSKPPVQYERAF